MNNETSTKTEETEMKRRYTVDDIADPKTSRDLPQLVAHGSRSPYNAIVHEIVRYEKEKELGIESTQKRKVPDYYESKKFNDTKQMNNRPPQKKSRWWFI